MPCALGRDASDHTPSLILTGGCNYIKWETTRQYKTTLPDSNLVCFPDAGHAIYLDQPRPYLDTIQSFLLDKPLPVQPWAGGSENPCVRR